MISVDSVRVGQLVAGNGLLYRLDPRTKLLGGLILTTGIFVANSYRSLLTLAILAAFLCTLSRVSLKRVVRFLRPVFLTLLGASLLHLFVSPGPYLGEFGPLKLSQAGLREAGLVDLRLISILTIAALNSWTTSPMAMADGLERLLAPLTRFGLPARELAMTAGITLRFVPTIVGELQRLMKAQAARGVDFSNGNLVQRAHALMPLVIPLIVATLERSEELALAMESRCYPGRGRSRFRQMRMTVLDGGVLVFATGLVAVLLLFLQ